MSHETISHFRGEEKSALHMPSRMEPLNPPPRGSSQISLAAIQCSIPHTGRVRSHRPKARVSPHDVWLSYFQGEVRVTRVGENWMTKPGHASTPIGKQTRFFDIQERGPQRSRDSPKKRPPAFLEAYSLCLLQHGPGFHVPFTHEAFSRFVKH